MNADDERLAQLVRLLRARQRLTQRALAVASCVPREDLMAIESGRVGTVKVDRVRRILEELGGRAKLTAWWNGAAADRLLDERHARIVERALPAFPADGWLKAVEVTFAEYGERGSIDILGVHKPSLMAVVGEVKSYIGSLEETNRTLDVKQRLAPKIVRARFGVNPRGVSRVLIFPEDRSIRRLIDRHSATMRSIYPSGSREFRAWLRNPVTPISAIWFLTEVCSGNRVKP